MNVTREELNSALQSKISHLVYPLNSILDESLGSVLWFGANGSGKIDEEPYSSSCRVNKKPPLSSQVQETLFSFLICMS